MINNINKYYKTLINAISCAVVFMFFMNTKTGAFSIWENPAKGHSLQVQSRLNPILDITGDVYRQQVEFEFYTIVDLVLSGRPYYNVNAFLDSAYSPVKDTRILDVKEPPIEKDAGGGRRVKKIYLGFPEDEDAVFVVSLFRDDLGAILADESMAKVERVSENYGSGVDIFLERMKSFQGEYSEERLSESDKLAEYMSLKGAGKKTFSRALMELKEKEHTFFYCRDILNAVYGALRRNKDLQLSRADIGAIADWFQRLPDEAVELYAAGAVIGVSIARMKPDDEYRACMTEVISRMSGSSLRPRVAGQFVRLFEVIEREGGILFLDPPGMEKLLGCASIVKWHGFDGIWSRVILNGVRVEGVRLTAGAICSNKISGEKASVLARALIRAMEEDKSIKLLPETFTRLAAYLRGCILRGDIHPGTYDLVRLLGKAAARPGRPEYLDIVFSEIADAGDNDPLKRTFINVLKHLFMENRNFPFAFGQAERFAELAGKVSRNDIMNILEIAEVLPGVKERTIKKIRMELEAARIREPRDEIKKPALTDEKNAAARESERRAADKTGHGSFMPYTSPPGELLPDLKVVPGKPYNFAGRVIATEKILKKGAEGLGRDDIRILCSLAGMLNEFFFIRPGTGKRIVSGCLTRTWLLNEVTRLMKDIPYREYDGESNIQEILNLMKKIDVKIINNESKNGKNEHWFLLVNGKIIVDISPFTGVVGSPLLINNGDVVILEKERAAAFDAIYDFGDSKEPCGITLSGVKLMLEQDNVDARYLSWWIGAWLGNRGRAMDENDSRQNADILKKTEKARRSITRRMASDNGLKELISLYSGITLSGDAEPVDISVDLTLLNGDMESLRANARAWAYLALSSAEFKNVNFIFERPSPSGAGVFPEALENDIRNMPGEDLFISVLMEEMSDIAGEKAAREFMNKRINRARRPDSVEICIWAKAWVKDLRKKVREGKNSNTRDKNRYFIPMDGITYVKGYGTALRDFNSALRAGLDKAFLALAKKREERFKDGEYEKVFKHVYRDLEKIYRSVSGGRLKLNEETLKYMMSGDILTKTGVELVFSMPPLTRLSLEKLKDLREMIDSYLSNA
ncbi:MAG: hypothetical protein ABH883_01035 [Candidatus Omnitrophota bacterium]